MKDVEFSELVASVPLDTRRLVSAERDNTGPIPLLIQNSPMFPVAVGVVRLLDTQFFNELLTLSEIPKLFKERLTSLERNLPDPPAGLSPGQTARTYSLYLYLKSLRLVPWSTPKRPRPGGTLPGTLGSRATTPPYRGDLTPPSANSRSPTGPLLVP